jgi:hypothetical protein
MMLFPALLLVLAAASPSSPADGVDPLIARVDDSAARRFADVWKASGGKPTAEQLQADYLANGGRAIEVFTPNRIGSAERLAKKVADNPQVYRDAVERCLPWVEKTNAELRVTYLGLKGLLPDRPLPQIAVVIGANNSGGTAAPGIQVIGLEVICRLSPDRADFQARMRQFFAHETVHTFQTSGQDSAASGLLGAALTEGVPDYVTEVVTGRVPNPPRDEWARSREAWIWQQFQADAAIIRAGTDSKGELNEKAQAAYRRWFANAGSAPEGWPDELGYWVGMRIAEAYLAASPDPHAAIDRLINPDDPAAILRESRYGHGFTR